MTTLLHAADPPPDSPTLQERGKFSHPEVTAKGERRASVAWEGLKTLWFNTGSLCNIECANCYIASSPTADHFVYLTPDDMIPYLNEIEAMRQGPVEIAFTGGEPFLNPHILELSELALARGHSLLVLTNAMRPMMRPRVQQGLRELHARFPGRLTLRVSLDHYSAPLHDAERGEGAFAKALPGLDWITASSIPMALAGRAAFAESEAEARAGYAALIADRGWQVEATDPGQLVLFPEMEADGDPPEITESCWGILSFDPRTLMCASSRMVVRRKGAPRARVLACTLLWEDPQFELHDTLAGALGAVRLNHPHCATFCVLGGASCSA